jgi:hypothetical protein
MGFLENEVEVTARTMTRQVKDPKMKVYEFMATGEIQATNKQEAHAAVALTLSRICRFYVIHAEEK